MSMSPVPGLRTLIIFIIQVERHFPALTRWRISKGNINIDRLKKEKGKDRGSHINVTADQLSIPESESRVNYILLQN